MNSQPQPMTAIDVQLGMADSFLHSGQLVAAEGMFRAVLLQNAKNFHAMHMMGLLCGVLGRLQESEEWLRAAHQAEPENAVALGDLGLLLSCRLVRPAEAVSCYRQALELAPESQSIQNNLAEALRVLQRRTEALEIFDSLIQKSPQDAMYVCNRGNVLLELGRCEEALADFQEAQRLQADYATAHWNEALCHLMLGDYLRGWEKYEWRWRWDDFSSERRIFTQPLWLGRGQGLQGQTILLHAEQGLGDTLQCLRYVSLVSTMADRVVLEVQVPLKDFCMTQFPGCTVVAKGESLPAFDCHCPFLSLPLAFSTQLDSIPFSQGYLTAPDDESWCERLPASGRPRIGLVWSGKSGHWNDANRSVPLQQLARLFELEADFVSLQKEIRQGDLDAWCAGEWPMQDFSDSLFSMADTAALIATLDLVISVDTSVAHLAGALGKPVWLMLSAVPEWRWLLDRADSPWYASARLYRQARVGDWQDVVEKVAGDAREFLHC